MFHNTLLVVPMANWHNFYQDILDAYSNKGRAFYDHGLIHLISSDVEWAALPGNEPVADANGDLQPVPHLVSLFDRSYLRIMLQLQQLHYIIEK